MKTFIIAVAAATLSLAAPAVAQQAQPGQPQGGTQSYPDEPGQQGIDARRAQNQQEMTERLEKMIEQDLVQAGLPRERARSEAGRLAQELQQVQQDFTSRLRDIRERYASVLSSGSTSEQQAQQQAADLVGQVARISPMQLAPGGSQQGTLAAQSQMQAQRAGQAQQAALPGGLSEQEQQRIEQQLRQAGVEAEKIQQLKLQNFPKEDTRQAILSSAEQQAEQVVQQIEQGKQQ